MVKKKIVLFMCFLFAWGYTGAITSNISGRSEIVIYSNDLPFDILTTGEDDGFRTLPSKSPFLVFVDDTERTLLLDFIKPIGEVEIAIFCGNDVVYSSTEGVYSPVAISIPIPDNLSGSFTIELKGKNGAYAYGCFSL